MIVHHHAMHMSDGIVDAPTSVAFGAIAVITLAICVWKARTELDERTVPLAGLVAAFIFAVQMVNFPILPGVSGHLLGGALAAILVGPIPVRCASRSCWWCSPCCSPTVASPLWG